MKELEKYLENLFKEKDIFKNWKNWMFGAIDFSRSSGIITEDQFIKLLGKYELI